MVLLYFSFISHWTEFNFYLNKSENRLHNLIQFDSTWNTQISSHNSPQFVHKSSQKVHLSIVGETLGPSDFSLTFLNSDIQT